MGSEAEHDHGTEHGHGHPLGHSHVHSHGHSHVHRIGDFNVAFAVGLVLNTGFVVAEAVYGVLAGSLALLADAGHNLSDVLGLAVAWGASVLVRRSPSPRRTYGLRRASILAALFNAVTLLVAVGAICWEAVRRFADPGPVAGGTILWVAAVGVGINALSALLFVRGQDDLNVRGAFLHLAADAAVSLGTVVAGAVLLLTGWAWIDPLVSLIVSGVILLGTWRLLTSALNLALDAVPEQIDPAAVRAYLAGLGGVREVHDLHIWAMSTTETALTAHLVMPGGFPGDAFLAEAGHGLHEQFGIGHATLQVETGDAAHPCSQSPEHRV